MHLRIANKKATVTATIDDIDNNVLILGCEHSFRFRDDDRVDITVDHDEKQVYPGKVLTSNPNELVVEVSEDVMQRLHLSERRKYTRYNLMQPLQCVLHEHHVSGFIKQYNGLIHDVSVNGFKLTSEYPLQVKQLFSVSIKDDAHPLGPFAAEVIVKNARFDHELDEKQYGLIIETTTNQSQELLNHYIAELQKQIYHKPSFFHKLRMMIAR